MTTTTAQLWALASQSLPAKATANQYAQLRTTLRGDLATMPWFGSRMVGPSDEGSMFVATNPTPGTAIAGITAADGLDDTEALLFMRLSPSSLKRLYLVQLELEVVAAGTNGTNFAYAMKVDKGNSRYASGGSSIAPRNPNAADASSSDVSQLYFGAVVPTAASADARLVDHGRVRTVIKVAGDKYRFVFGDSSPGVAAGVATEGTAQLPITIACPQVILGPGDMWLFHEFAASQSVAASYQFKLWWTER